MSFDDLHLFIKENESYRYIIDEFCLISKFISNEARTLKLDSKILNCYVYWNIRIIILDVRLFYMRVLGLQKTRNTE